MSLEQPAKVATTLIDSLKTQPLVLALVVFNLAFVIIVFFAGKDTREHQSATMRVMLDNQSKLQEMLSHCQARTELPASPTIGGT